MITLLGSPAPAAELLHGEETVVYADAGYQGIEKRLTGVKRHPELVLRRHEIWPTPWGCNPGLLTP